MTIRPLPVLALLAAAAFLAPSAQAQGFVFTKIVDNNDPIPGGAGALFAPTDEPALDGLTVVFRNGGVLNPDSIWSIARGGAFTKLVDLNTPVPFGVGNFSALIARYSAPGAPLLRDGTVVFCGQDSNTAAGSHQGTYSVSVGGGAVARVVDYNTPVPGGTGPFDGQFGIFSIDAGRVAFQGSGPGNGGVFAANFDGSSLIAIADGLHPASSGTVFNVVNFSSPSVSGGRALFFGNTVFDPSNGFNALYLNPTDVSYTYQQVASSDEGLPGDPSTVPPHTRYDGFRLDGNTLAFVADDANSTPNYFGLFTASTTGGAFTKVVAGTDSLPGLKNINRNSLRDISLGGGMVAFTALDDVNNVGLYAANADGTGLSKVLATGDPGPYADTGATVPSITGYSLSLGANGVNNGNILFRSAGGIYLATPAALSADLQSSLTHTPANGSAGTPLTFAFTVTNAGPASATDATASLTLPVGLAFVSATGGGAFDGVSTVNFASLGTLTVGQSASFTVIAQVNSVGAQAAGAFAFSPTPDPTLNNNHAQDLILPPPPVASTAGYSFARIADNLTPVPDRTGQTFGIPGGNSYLPALDAGKVVFVTNDPDNLSVLWSANADGSGITRLLDTVTPVPAGEGDTFAGTVTPRLRGGEVVFLGFGHNQHDGVYSLPVGGGAVAGLVTQGSPHPEGGKSFDYQSFIQSLNFGYLGDGYIGIGLQGGVYAYPVTGGAAKILVYPDTVITGAFNRGIVFFGPPSISGTRAVFQGSNSELLETYLDEHRFVALADQNTPVAGSAFVFNNGDNFQDCQVEGDTVVFRGLTGSNPVASGIYSRTAGGAVVTLADQNTAVPGGTGNFTAFSISGSPEVIALNAGEAVFVGVDSANKTGLYSVPATGGGITKIVAAGDSMGNGLTLTGFSQPPFQANGLGGHQVVFRADFFDATANAGGSGYFVATPGGFVQAGLPTVTLVPKKPGQTQTTERFGGAIKLILSRTGDTSSPLAVNFKVKGAAQNGVDYNLIKSPKVIPAGSSSVKIKIVPIDRGITGGGALPVKIQLLPGDYVADTESKLKFKIIDNE